MVKIDRPRAKLTTRDLINVGIFTAVYFVILFSFGMMGFFGPAFQLAGFVLGTLANGIVVMLYLTRVAKFGALTITMTIVGLLLTLMGHAWFGILGFALLGVIADAIATWAPLPRVRRHVLAYSVLGMTCIIPLAPMVWDTAGYHAHVAAQMGTEYADAYLALFSPSSLIFYALGGVVLGFIGGLVGQRMLANHFRRAGVT